MTGNIVGIDGHDHTSQNRPWHIGACLIRPKRSVGADHRRDSLTGAISNHCRQILVRQRFPSYKQQITDVVFNADIDDLTGLLQCYALALLRIEFIGGETAEIAFGVADVRNGELEITRPPVVEHFLE